MKPTLNEIVQERILILDGAMGTVIQQYGLQESDFQGSLPRRQRQGKPILMKGNNDLLCLTRPDIITDIHERYLKAGADIISTNTFNAQAISQADYLMEDYARQMNLEGARLARRAADKYSTKDKPRYVAGSVGPTNKTCSMSPDVSNPAARELNYDQLFDAYCEQMDGLIEGGVDAILIETIFDTLNAKVAIDAATTIMRKRNKVLPVMLSVTISDLAGRTLSGQTLEAFLASVSTYPIFSVGLNCSFGARQMKPYLRELAQRAPYYITCHPNAGLPNQMGLYDETPETMAPQIAEFIDEGLVNIVGGCCGTTPDFIEKYTDLVRGERPLPTSPVRGGESGERIVQEWKTPHVPVERPQALWLSGLDILEIKSTLSPLSSLHSPLTPPLTGEVGRGLFTNVGERCNVAGSRKFLRLIKEKQYDEAVSIARHQVSDGALVIDINMDDGLLDARTEMTHFLNLIAAEPDVARVPVMIDSSDWQVIVAGLKCVQGKCIVNSISLKEGEEVFKEHARDVMRYGAAVVVMCFDEQGQATTYERRIAIAQRAYRILTEEVGMQPHDIIFDPNILAIATGIEEHDSYALDFIRATRWIRENLSGAHVSGGVSNLSFSFRGNNYIREAMHAVFLYHAIQAGMDFGIVNPATKVQYDDIPSDQLTIIEDAILHRKADAAERLTKLSLDLQAAADAAGTAGKGTSANATSSSPQEQPSALSLEERLQQALIRGIGDTLQADLDEALAKYPRAVDIIEGPLMQGMSEVGKRFGAGKMFLPQVVKTARTMKQAVAILQPHIEAQRQTGTSKAGKVLLATVKGDVHDIGKNIVAVVMACNNYEVIDMGVMVPAEQIVRKAIEEKVDIIGLSGLITPSLEEMVNVAQELKRAGLHIPIMIGGATTSELHVALKIAPVYDGPVVWMKDASQNALAAARLMDNEQAVKQELDNRYTDMRQKYAEEQQQLLTLDEARKNKLNLWKE
jgi:5-methyltetrahydrofolate--homocysteine methyltransferase